MTQTLTKTSALATAARSASTAYKVMLTADVLANMLRTGRAPDCFPAQLMAFIDELPRTLVDQAIDEAVTNTVSREQILANIRHWAIEWQTHQQGW